MLAWVMKSFCTIWRDQQIVTPQMRHIFNCWDKRHFAGKFRFRMSSDLLTIFTELLQSKHVYACYSSYYVVGQKVPDRLFGFSPTPSVAYSTGLLDRRCDPHRKHDNEILSQIISF